MFRFFNSASLTKEDFVPNFEGKVSIYSCGPTVYGYAHIGNLRSYIFSDLLVKSLRLGGYHVTHAMNITDVDDKIIGQLTKKYDNVSLDNLKDYTKPFIQHFFNNLAMLNITKANLNPCATEHIGTITSILESLIKKGYAYENNGSIYYSVNRFKQYGKLSRVDPSNMKSGTRYNVDEYSKDDIRDFALWKLIDDKNTIYWDTPYGRGRPGWHIECSAMIHKHFGSVLDIHTGGIDLLFPHHENEIAQSCSAFETNFVNYWLHCEHLLVDGHKMSKSLGNVYTLHDVLDKGYSALALRYLLLSVHYRQKLNFTFASLEQVSVTLSRVYLTYDRLMNVDIINTDPKLLDKTLLQEIEDQCKKLQVQFMEYIKDDLNMSGSLSVLHDFLNHINFWLDRVTDTLDIDSKTIMHDTFLYFDTILSVLEKPSDNILPYIKELVQKRNEYRKSKDYARADEIRDQICELGYQVSDTDRGSRLHKIANHPIHAKK